MNRRIMFLIILSVLLFQSGCLYAVRYDGDYHGKVVDEETREPIEGAVVLGNWAVYHFGVAGGYTTFYDAREAVTDKSGEFTIPGQGLRVFSSVGPMGVLIYKAGYTYYEAGSWDMLKTGKFRKQQVKWEGDMPVFPLRKLSEEMRKDSSTLPSLPLVPGNKVRTMLIEINKELLQRGLDQYLVDPIKVRKDK